LGQATQHPTPQERSLAHFLYYRDHRSASWARAGWRRSTSPTRRRYDRAARFGSASPAKGSGTHWTSCAPARPGALSPVRLGLAATVKFFGRYKTGYIRDGVVLWVHTV